MTETFLGSTGTSAYRTRGCWGSVGYATAFGNSTIKPARLPWQMMVTGLLTPSSFSEAGGQMGDRILAINGDDYRQIIPERFCEFVLTPVGKQYTGPLSVTVQRDNEVLHLEVASPD